MRRSQHSHRCLTSPLETPIRDNGVALLFGGLPEPSNSQAHQSSGPLENTSMLRVIFYAYSGHAGTGRRPAEQARAHCSLALRSDLSSVASALNFMMPASRTKFVNPNKITGATVEDRQGSDKAGRTFVELLLRHGVPREAPPETRLVVDVRQLLHRLGLGRQLRRQDARDVLLHPLQLLQQRDRDREEVAAGEPDRLRDLRATIAGQSTRSSRARPCAPAGRGGEAKPHTAQGSRHHDRVVTVLLVVCRKKGRWSMNRKSRTRTQVSIQYRVTANMTAWSLQL